MQARWIPAVVCLVFLGAAAAPPDCGSAADDPAMASGSTAYSALPFATQGNDACGSRPPVLGGAMMRDEDNEVLHGVPTPDVTGPIGTPHPTLLQQ